MTKKQIAVNASASPACHEGSDIFTLEETSQPPLDGENISDNRNIDPGATPCMPLNESFHDVCPPITECFKCDVEEYEHEHEIGPYKDHHHSLQDGNASEERCDREDCDGTDRRRDDGCLIVLPTGVEEEADRK